MIKKNGLVLSYRAFMDATGMHPLTGGRKLHTGVRSKAGRVVKLKCRKIGRAYYSTPEDVEEFKRELEDCTFDDSDPCPLRLLGGARIDYWWRHGLQSASGALVKLQTTRSETGERATTRQYLLEFAERLMDSGVSGEAGSRRRKPPAALRRILDSPLWRNHTDFEWEAAEAEYSRLTASALAVSSVDRCRLDVLSTALGFHALTAHAFARRGIAGVAGYRIRLQTLLKQAGERYLCTSRELWEQFLQNLSDPCYIGAPADKCKRRSLALLPPPWPSRALHEMRKAAE